MAENEALLAQYRSLADEIKSIGGFVERTLTLTVTAVTALISLALTLGNWMLFLPPLLMLIPSLAIVLSQLEGVMRAATYIHVFIERRIPDLKWEGRLILLRARSPRHLLGLAFTVFYLMMTAVPILLAWAFLSPWSVRNVLILATATALGMGIITPTVLWGRRYFRAETYQRFCQRWEAIASVEAESNATPNACQPGTR